MSDAKPPDRPSSDKPPRSMLPATPKRGWWDRLLALGEHNKLIAAATLVTLATGVPYLAYSAVRLFTGADETETMRRLFAEELRHSGELLRVQAGEQDFVVLRTEVEAMVASQLAALESVRDEALRAGVARAEQDRLLEAIGQFSLGRPTAALDEIARLAQAQEARGAVAEAADTWRRRGVLQVFTDGRAAIRDLQRAEELHAGGAADRLTLGELLANYEDVDVAYPVLAEAAALARAEGDPRVLGRALVALSLTVKQASPDWSEERDRVGRGAAREAATLFLGQLLADPGDAEALTLFADAIGRYALVGVSTAEDAEALLDEVAVAERTASAMTARADEPLEAVGARLQFWSAKGILLEALGRHEEAVAAWSRIGESVLAALPRARNDIHFLGVAVDAVYTPTELLMASAEPDWAAVAALCDVGLAVMRRAIENDPDNPGGPRTVVTLLSRLGFARERQGMAAEAVAAVGEALEIARVSRSRFPDDAPLWEFRALVEAAEAALPVDAARAQALAAEADRLYREVVVPGPYSDWVAPHRARLDGLPTDR